MTQLANAIKYEAWYQEYRRHMAISSIRTPCTRQEYAERIIMKGRRF